MTSTVWLCCHFKTRIEGHIKKGNKSHIFKHLNFTTTCFESYFKIIDKANSKCDLKIKEALHINWRKPKCSTKSCISHPFAMASVPLVLYFFVFAFLFHVLFLLSLTLIIDIFYFLNYTSLLLHLITTYLLSKLSSIIFSISALIISIFYCLDCTLLLLHLIITHLVVDFIITVELAYVLGNYYGLYKYHSFCTNQLTCKR